MVNSLLLGTKKFLVISVIAFNKKRRSWKKSSLTSKEFLKLMPLTHAEKRLANFISERRFCGNNEQKRYGSRKTTGIPNSFMGLPPEEEETIRSPKSKMEMTIGMKQMMKLEMSSWLTLIISLLPQGHRVWIPFFKLWTARCLGK